MKFRPWHLLLFGLLWFPACGICAPKDNSALAVEQKLWQWAFQEQAELEQRQSILDQPELKRYVEDILARLWECVQSDLPPLQVRLIMDSTLDAFAYPNGVCYVTSGMISQTRSQDQLAMIFAHEIIHYTRRHALAALAIAHPDTWESRDCQSPLQSNTTSDNMVADAEQQADREGLELMVRAGFCADEALAILAQRMPDTGNFLGSMRFGGQGAPVQPLSDGMRNVADRLTKGNSCSIDSSVTRIHLEHISPALKANASQALVQGQWDKAANSICLYLSIHPDDPEGYYIWGEIMRLGAITRENDSPLTAYQRAIALDGGFVPAYQALGVLYLKAGQLDKAKNCFERWLSLSTDSMEAHYVREYLELCKAK